MIMMIMMLVPVVSIVERTTIIDNLSIYISIYVMYHVLTVVYYFDMPTPENLIKKA